MSAPDSCCRSGSPARSAAWRSCSTRSPSGASPAAALGLPGLLAVAALVGAASAIANNLPVSVSAAAVLAGPSAYGATIGLAIDSLATPHGSVATLIASELAGPGAPAFPTRRFVALAAMALVAATLLLWALP